MECGKDICVAVKNVFVATRWVRYGNHMTVPIHEKNQFLRKILYKEGLNAWKDVKKKYGMHDFSQFCYYCFCWNTYILDRKRFEDLISRNNSELIFISLIELFFRKDLMATCFVGVCVSQPVCVKLLDCAFCVAHISLTRRRIGFVHGVLMPYSRGNIMWVAMLGQRSLRGSCWMKH